MKKSKHDLIRSHYEPLVSKGGSNHQMLDWGSRDSQFARFSVLADCLGESGILDDRRERPSLLDVGCGLTDLQTFFEQEKIAMRYVGVDITPAIVAEAHRHHPDRAILLGDIFQAPPFPPRSFDVVFCSGTLNLKLGNNDAFAACALRGMLALARKRVIVNFLHQRTRERYRQCFYYSPEAIAQTARRLAPANSRLRIIDDYLENDFTLEIVLPMPA